MRGAVLTGTSGFFPFGIAEVGIRCDHDDLFGWVKSSRKFDETLIALPTTRAEAEPVLASKLQSDHRFTAADAAKTAKHLFEEAFADAGKDPESDGALCSDPGAASINRT